MMGVGIETVVLAHVAGAACGIVWCDGICPSR